ncbi:DNA polymerase III subunit beta [Desulfobacterota bacterium AH_259_B03_O07]|nr:DNA polymerase III subunit beta [Desulfobacterota bacterium AH_259_B03_O07]
MKFNVDVSKFSEKLGLIQGIAERRATMPVLSHVLLQARSNVIELSVTDLETTMSATVDADVSKDGSLSLPAKKLNDIVNELPQGNIEFEEIGNHWVEMRTSSANFKIAGLPNEDFPVIPEASSEELFSIQSDKFDDMISKTIFAVSPDDLRRNLAGIYFEKNGKNNLKLAATDGHRLSIVENDLNSEIKLDRSVLVPKKGVAELRKMLKLGEEIKIGCGKNFFMAEGEGIRLIVRLIDAEFPDYNQVIPKSTKNTFQIGRERFLSALRRVSVLSSEKTRSVKISISTEGMTLLSVSPEVGEAKELLPLEYSGTEIELGFNARYIMDVLEVLSEENVELGLSDELSPAVIKPVGGEKYISVIMPMRV